MLQALGFGMLDSDGKQVPFGAVGLKHLCLITSKEVNKKLSECHFKIACDVENPLCGENGCSYVFAPQKGATKQEIEKMDQWMRQRK